MPEEIPILESECIPNNCTFYIILGILFAFGLLIIILIGIYVYFLLQTRNKYIEDLDEKYNKDMSRIELLQNAFGYIDPTMIREILTYPDSFFEDVQKKSGINI